jgi:glycosyltransferase involved in cell wall biosynthesis
MLRVGVLGAIERSLKSVSGRAFFKMRCARIASAVSEYEPEYVLGLQSYQTGFAAQAISQALGVPYITWEHLTGYERNVPLKRGDAAIADMFEKSYATACVSDTLLDVIRERFSIELPQGRVVPNPLPQEFEQAPSEYTLFDDLGINPKGVVIGAWTAWREQKRLDVLLEAFQILRGSCSDAVLVVAGSIPDGYCEGMRQTASRNGVFFVGRLARDQVHQLTHLIDCACISSDYETFGLPMVEAFAAGKPVVSTECAGPDQFISDKRLGTLCERGDAQALAMALLETVSSIEAYDPEYIKRFARETFGFDVMCETWRGIYREQ